MRDDRQNLAAKVAWLVGVVGLFGMATWELIDYSRFHGGTTGGQYQPTLADVATSVGMGTVLLMLPVFPRVVRWLNRPRY